VLINEHDELLMIEEAKQSCAGEEGIPRTKYHIPKTTPLEPANVALY